MRAEVAEVREQPMLVFVRCNRPQWLAARAGFDWALFGRQVGGLVRLELRRLLLTRRAVILGLAAAIPVVIVLLVGSIPIGGQTVLERFGNRTGYETIFETVFLGAILFFGCLYVFFNLFRDEILERSLHYLLLTPLRREVVVVGKFVAAVTAVAVLFMASTLLSYLLIYLPVGVTGAIEDLTAGPGGVHLFAYFGVTLLACIGYGSLFTLIGMVFRNPIIPAGAPNFCATQAPGVAHLPPYAHGHDRHRRPRDPRSSADLQVRPRLRPGRSEREQGRDGRAVPPRPRRGRHRRPATPSPGGRGRQAPHRRRRDRRVRRHPPHPGAQPSRGALAARGDDRRSPHRAATAPAHPPLSPRQGEETRGQTASRRDEATPRRGRCR